MIKQSARSGVEILLARFAGQATERTGEQPGPLVVRAFLRELSEQALAAEKDFRLGLRHAPEEEGL